MATNRGRAFLRPQFDSVHAQANAFNQHRGIASFGHPRQAISEAPREWTLKALRSDSRCESWMVGGRWTYPVILSSTPRTKKELATGNAAPAESPPHP